MAMWLLWQPMETAPQQGYIVVRRKGGVPPIVVSWSGKNGWVADDSDWDDEDATGDSFCGWSPVPPLEA